VFNIGSGPISWSSKKQPIVSLSSTEAEYKSLCSATCEAIWLRRILEDVGETQQAPTVIRCDNQSTIKLTNNLVYHARTKHIDTQHQEKNCNQKKLTYHIVIQMKISLTYSLSLLERLNLKCVEISCTL